MATALLDTQVWNYLAEPDATDVGDVTVEMLRAAVQRHELVGTFDVLQELMGAGPSNPSKYKQMVGLFFKLIGPRLLLPLKERHIGEAVAGGLLPPDKRFASRERRRDARLSATRRTTVLEIAEQVHADGVAFKNDEEALRAKFKEELNAASQSMKPHRLRKWYEALDIDDWVGDIADDGITRAHYNIQLGDDCGSTRFPSSWMFTAYRLARIPATIGEGRKIQRSDLADAHHVASGPYVDLIVTNDGELLRTVELMSSRSLPFRCVGLAEFVAM